MKKEKEYCFKDQEKVIFVKNCSIADKQYDVSNNSYEAQFNHVAKINGQEIRFFDFVINVVSGTDYNFIERMGGLQPNYKEEELYGITGFMTTS